MAGILLFALNSPGATSGPVVRARRESSAGGSGSGGGMMSRLRSMGSGSGVGDMGWSSGSGPQASGSGSTAAQSPSTSTTSPPVSSRPVVHRSYSTSTPASSSLPSYGSSSSSSDVPIPTYESVLSETANRIREMRISALAAANYTEPGQGPTGLARVRRLGEISESAIDDESEEDDPLVPRVRRGAPVPNLRPLRRNTFSGTSSEADAAGSVRLGPEREGLLTPPTEVHPDDEGDGVDVPDVPDEPLPPALAEDDRPIPSTSDPNRHALVPTAAGSEMAATIDLPAPPANALPAYSAHLGPQELRLISTVHLDQTHPASAFFAALANSSVSAGPVPPVDPQREQPSEYSVGGKKMKVFINRGGMRMNQTHTGPLYIKVGRGGKIEGRVEIGKVDYGMSLEVAIIGLVNTSYYVRGQYTLIDTLPLVRRLINLYPARNGTTAVQDLGPEPLFGDSAPAASASVEVAPAGRSTPDSATAPGTSSTVNPPTAPPLSRTISRPNFLKARKTNPNSKIMTKDGVLYLTQGQTFDFNLVMPNQHYRDSNVELPPSCQIYQVGMQAGVEYVLRIKMGRKGWRLNETITLPLVYEPRAYITPRRLRALTTDDPMNPGWRTIRLHGGKPSPKTNTNPPATDPPPVGPGVEGTLLLPSPPILFISHGQPPPPIPFHLHFHSSLTLPLSTFSDPRESNFIIRLMRVATLRIGTEKEIRRMEIPSKIEIWQEGGARVALGNEGNVGGGGVSVRVLDPGPAPPPAFTHRDPEAGGSRENVSVSADEGEANAEVEGEQTTEEGAAVPSRPAPTINTTLGTPPPARPMTLSPTTATPTSPGSPGQADGTGRRRLSFLRRRSSSIVTPTQPSAPDASISRILSNIPPSISESADPGSAPSAPVPDPTPEPEPEATLFAPLSHGATDVHLLGELTIPHKITGTDVVRRMVQSFNTPDIGITYVLEVGIQPKRGAVKEAFEHLWGGGIVEVVLGNKEAETEDGAEAVASAATANL